MIDFSHDEERTPKTWRKAAPFRNDDPAAWRDDFAIVTCPNSHSCRLSRGSYAVAANGALSPHFHCPVADCGFHGEVRLAGWAP